MRISKAVNAGSRQGPRGRFSRCEGRPHEGARRCAGLRAAPRDVPRVRSNLQQRIPHDDDDDDDEGDDVVSCYMHSRGGARWAGPQAAKKWSRPTGMQETIEHPIGPTSQTSKHPRCLYFRPPVDAMLHPDYRIQGQVQGQRRGQRAGATG